MSKSKPVYETPWWSEYIEYNEPWFSISTWDDYGLCAKGLRAIFGIGAAKRIKIALFTTDCAEAVRITERRNDRIERFLCDGTPTCFTGQIDELLHELMNIHGVETLYAKCYIEA